MLKKNLLVIAIMSLSIAMTSSTAFGQPKQQKKNAKIPGKLEYPNLVKTNPSSSQKTKTKKPAGETSGTSNSTNQNSLYTNNPGGGVLGAKNSTDAKNSTQIISNQPNGKTKNPNYRPGGASLGGESLPMIKNPQNSKSQTNSNQSNGKTKKPNPNFRPNPTGDGTTEQIKNPTLKTNQPNGKTKTPNGLVFQKIPPDNLKENPADTMQKVQSKTSSGKTELEDVTFVKGKQPLKTKSKPSNATQNSKQKRPQKNRRP